MSKGSLKITTIALPQPLMAKMDQTLALIGILNRSDWIRNAVKNKLDRMTKLQSLYTETTALYLELYGTLPPSPFHLCKNKKGKQNIFTINMPAEDKERIKTTTVNQTVCSVSEFLRFTVIEYLEITLQSVYGRLIAEKKDRDQKQECAKLQTNDCPYHAGCLATGYTGICKAFQAVKETTKLNETTE